MNKNLQKMKEANKKICDRYPFLIPRDWEGNRMDKYDDWDYTFTDYDLIPAGWQRGFGEQMCEEIRDALIEVDELETFYFTDIKEKYGHLRMYFWGSDKLADIAHKYEELSGKTCIVCGRPATHMTKGWIMPMCDHCDREDEEAIEKDAEKE